MALLPLPLALPIPANAASQPGLWLAVCQRLGRASQLGAALRRPSALGMGGALLLGATLLLAVQPPALAGSALLDRVKQNPKVAGAICAELRSLNAQGIVSTSPQAVNRIAAMQGLNATDAEILTTYVVGLHCPDVR